MRVIRIEDAHDPRLAHYAGVREPRQLRDHGLMIVEGRFVVRRALSVPHIHVRSLLLNDAAFSSLGDMLDGIAADLDVFVTTPDVITGATGFNMHRGCLALADRPPAQTMEAVLADGRLVVILERVVDPDNVGSVVRSAEAFGVDATLLSPGCADPFYRKAIRTSSGSALVVPFASAAPWPDVLSAIRAAGFATVAMTLDGAMDIGDFVATPAARGRVAVLFGSEGHGLTPGALACADHRVRIPMTGALDSLNIATTAGIVLHRLHEVRRRAFAPISCPNSR